MHKLLQDSKIVLCVTGSIAAYKAAELTRLLVKQGANLRIVMTQSAKEFISPLTFHSLSGNNVITDIWDAEYERGMGHIELAKWAEIILVAPASANFIANFSGGVARDIMLSMLLATKAKVVIAPAMNQQMHSNQNTIENINHLQAMGHHILSANSGEQACGDVGEGRLQEPEQIVSALSTLQAIWKNQQATDFAGKKVLISAGATSEPIDPVRYITNRSSGKMGIAIANAACMMNADTTLIAANVDPTVLELLNPAVHLVRAMSVDQMYDCVHNQMQTKMDCFVSVAAISDWKMSQQITSKIKKQPNQSTLDFTLERTKDIIASLPERYPDSIIVGFAAETEDLIKNAVEKLEKKRLDLIVTNDVSAENSAFTSDSNQLNLIDKKQNKPCITALKNCSKIEASVLLMNYIHDNLL